MQLYSRIIGGGTPILILHGLFGMSDNWLTIARALGARGFSVHVPDLRNHGRSPHAPTHRYTDMCDDLVEYLDCNALDAVHIIGHSMGGKLAMIFALLYPEKLAKLVVVDIAPSAYADSSYHSDIIDTLMDIDLNSHRESRTIRKELTTRFKDPRLAMFLTKNFIWDNKNKCFNWKLNLPVLKKYLHHLQIGLEELTTLAPCPVRTCFIKGNDSPYYQAEHEADRLFFFPNSEVVGVAAAGHWVQSDQPLRLQEIVLSFFQTAA
jgi:esterase